MHISSQKSRVYCYYAIAFMGLGIVAAYAALRFPYNFLALIVVGLLSGVSGVAFSRCSMIRERDVAVAALRASEEKFNKAFRHSADVIGIIRIADKKYIDVNDVFFRVFGYEHAEVIDHSSDQFGLWENQLQRANLYKQLEQEGGSYNIETTWRTKYRDIRTGVTSAEKAEIGGETCAVFVWNDITELKAAERALREAHDELEDKVEERSWELYAATRELEAVNKEYMAMNEELHRINRDLAEEVVERKRAEEELYRKTEEVKRLVFYDALTGLPNRAYLNEWLVTEMANARLGSCSGALMFIDLDDLKTMNDTFGHTHGDALIAAAGSLIVEQAGKDAFVARIGGDEFIVVLPGGYEQAEAACIADRILDTLCREQEVMGVQFHTSASVGVALYPGDGETVEELLKNADNAMYAAKKAGKNCWRFYMAAMQAEAYERMTLTNSLRQAISRGELLLHYQPQVLDDGVSVVGFEALLRWNSAEFGFISPARLIPLAEQSGLIHDIGQWVLLEACRFARRLKDMGRGDLVVAVNVSAYQMAKEDFTDTVRAVLDQVGIDPQQLELEITESALMTSLEDATRKLMEIRAMGVGVSLDDFGIGYSSLSYLRHLPVKKLKLDKSFIDMIEKDNVLVRLISAIIQMAHVLDIEVVAEGVEKEQQLEYLGTNGCDLIQGYLTGRPVPEREVIKTISRSVPHEVDNTLPDGLPDQIQITS